MGGGKAIGIWLIESNLISALGKFTLDDAYNILIIRPIIIIPNTYIYIGGNLIGKRMAINQDIVINSQRLD